MSDDRIKFSYCQRQGLGMEVQPEILYEMGFGRIGFNM